MLFGLRQLEEIEAHRRVLLVLTSVRNQVGYKANSSRELLSV